jgi:hypothetical protein
MINITRKGFKEFEGFIKSLPRGVKVVAMRAIGTYLIGDGKHGLKHYPPYKFITRRKAYGKSFESLKQQRWFFAAKAEGKILPGYPRRTGKIQRGWEFNESGSDWRRVNITNEAEGVGWVMGDNQARLNALADWRKAVIVITSNMRGAIRAGQQAVNRWLKQKGRL